VDMGTCEIVTPAHAGAHRDLKMDSRVRGNDGIS